MGSSTSRPDTEPTPIEAKEEMVTNPLETQEEDDEPDEWDKRIFSTGCADENMKMTDCYYDKKDWRACAKEVEQFKQCWKRNGNEERTATKDV